VRNVIIMLIVALGATAFFVLAQPQVNSEVLSQQAVDQYATEISTQEANRRSTAAQENENGDEEQIKEVRIQLGNFFFEGPEGRSGSENKTQTAIEPQVIARLKNGEPVKLIFENTSPIVDHEVISPLFSAPEEMRFAVPPSSEFEIEITPNFLTVEDGGTLSFHISCHVRHGQSTDHYHLGMHGLIEVVP